MKNIKVEDCEFELLLQVFNDAISYARRRDLHKTVTDYRRLLTGLRIQAKRQESDE